MIAQTSGLRVGVASIGAESVSLQVVGRQKSRVHARLFFLFDGELRQVTGNGMQARMKPLDTAWRLFPALFFLIGARGGEEKPPPPDGSDQALRAELGLLAVCEYGANQFNLAKTDSNPDNVKPLGMVAK
ncbi:MAG TPA: hypothetical protein VG324_04785 [Blastocatellia bacterium]|nr:hypothetical protein [Blastocatellia bacterium]